MKSGFNMPDIKVGDLVEPKPQYLGLTGEVTATLRKHGTRWLFINGSMLPAFKYRRLR
jgi:hypothetical protein